MSAPPLPAPAHHARELLTRLHGPALGRITALTDPRPNPVDGLVAATGSRWDAVVGPPVSRVCVVGAGGDAVELAGRGGSSRAPRWSPDGRWLAYTSDHRLRGVHQVVVAPRGRLHDAVDQATLPGSVEHLAWSPDGRRLLAVVAGHGAEIAGAMGSGRVPLRPEDRREPSAPIVRSTTPDGAAPDGEWRRLWAITPGEPVARCATPAGPCTWEAAWAGPDAAVAVVSDRPEEDAWYGARLALVPLDGGAPTTLFTSDRQLGVPAGSPSGVRVACVEAPCSDRTLVAGRVVVVDPRSGDVARPEVGVDATHLVWLDDDRLLVSGLAGMTTVVVELDLRTGVARERWRTRAAVGPRQPEAWPGPGGTLLAAADRWDEPSHLVEIDAGGDEHVRWRGAHAGTAAVAGGLGELHDVAWSAPDGWDVEGLLVQPPGGGPHPLVLYPHGGPVALYRRRFLMGYVSVPLLVERGYAVLMPNPRGSAGYGWAFADAVHGDMGGADTGDLLAGVDALVARGVADPDRLAVMGGSYGGYMTCWLVSQTDRFRVAAASAPVTNWVSQQLQSNIPQWGARFLPDADRYPAGGYVERSPVFHADAIRTPLLLDAGAHDRCCPPTQALELHEALRQRQVPTELVVYPDDAHNIPTGELLVDDLARLVGWFERWCPVD